MKALRRITAPYETFFTNSPVKPASEAEWENIASPISRVRSELPIPYYASRGHQLSLVGKEGGGAVSQAEGWLTLVINILTQPLGSSSGDSRDLRLELETSSSQVCSRTD